jgi:uncharacterized membrane protein
MFDLLFNSSNALSILAVIFSVSALRKISTLKGQVAQLTTRLADVTSEIDRLHDDTKSAAQHTTDVASEKNSIEQTTEHHMPELVTTGEPCQPAMDDVQPDLGLPAFQPPQNIAASTSPTLLERFTSHLKQHWLIWVGGAALLTGTAYLMQYIAQYIEFTPLMRVGSALIVSLLIIFTAERWHRHERNRSIIGIAYAPAVLSATGCMGLYCTILSSYFLYQFLSPLSSLIMMGIVSIFTLSLYLRLGPLMAVMGIIAGYTAPLWFFSHNSPIMALSCYMTFIAASGLFFTTQVRKSWLFPLTLIPFSAWMLIALYTVSNEALLSWSFIFLPIAIYFLLGVPNMGWRLNPHYVTFIAKKYRHTPIASAFIASLIILTFVLQSRELDAYLTTILLILILAFLPNVRGRYTNEPYLSVTVSAIAASLVVYLSPYPDALSSATTLLFLAVMTTLLLARTLLQYSAWSKVRSIQYLMLGSPLVLICAGWMSLDTLTDQDMWIWNIYALFAVASYLYLARWMPQVQSTLYACLHLIAAIGLCFNFSGIDLSYALALQSTLIAWQTRQGSLVPSPWILKLVVSAVLIRVTIASVMPQFIIDYSDMGGSLIPLGIVLILFYSGYLLIRTAAPTLKQWLEGALVHLMALMVFSQTQYWLADGDITHWYEMDFTHLVIYSCECLVMSMVYQFRATKTETLKRLYHYYASALFCLSLAIILYLNTAASPLLVEQVSGADIPILNWLTPGWLISGLLVLVITHYQMLPDFIEKRVGYIVGAFPISVWIGLSIRQFWQPVSITLASPTSMAEQISYSVVTIVIGLMFTLLGITQKTRVFNMIGLSVLAIVSVKVVFIDTAALEGILRALSFLILGSVLVAVGWGFQKLNDRAAISSD